MDRHNFIDFMADRLPTGIIALRRIRRDGYVVGWYLMDECSGAKLGCPQFTMLRHEGEPFMLSWQSLGQRTTLHQRIHQGQLHIHPPEHIIQASWSAKHMIFGVALSIEFLTKAAVFSSNSGQILSAQIGIFDSVLSNILDLIKGQIARPASGLTLSHACAMLAGMAYDTYGAQTNSVPVNNGGLGAARQQRILAYIDEHLYENLTLEELSAEAGLSSSYFGKAFGVSIGTSPLRYVAQRRIHKAKELLLNGKLTITDIALSIGYATPSHFTDSFHRATGVTPSQWRRHRL